MDQDEQHLRSELERLASEPDDGGALQTVVRKGRALRRRRRWQRAGTVVLAVVLLGLVGTGVFRLVDDLRSEPAAGGWSSMGAPGAGETSTPVASDTSTSVEAPATTAGVASTGGPATAGQPTTEPSSAVVYTNTQYGFTFSLPESWKGFSIVSQQWEGYPLDDTGQGSGEQAGPIHGPLLLIRHPLWTQANPRQDIPIMVFTLAQWQQVEQEKLSVSAAPIPPSELGRNDMFVFALPARYNYAFPTGYEEVETILEGHPLQPIAAPPPDWEACRRTQLLG
jgi:hypothetical protein